ncbi:helix-turn-helix domain-containing protein [Vibrio vulnificus]|nr:helix-turn-helix domain-containing protein [Vibrio vulnificus]
MNKKNIIYGLRDPRNDLYYYIGKSTVGVSRPLSHLEKSHSQKVNEWVDSLKNNGFSPMIDIIEEVEELNNLAEREKAWIEYYYEINEDLLNVMLLPREIEELRSDSTDLEFESLLKLFSNFRHILKRERVFRGLTQEEMSNLANLSRKTVSSLENGANVKTGVIESYIEVLLTKPIVTEVYKERVRT